MSINGAFTFVLHSHMPYARMAGRWPHGEEWIHEAASETYIPLLDTLYNLKEEGVAFKLTIGLTPTLSEQLSDQVVLENLAGYLDMKIASAERDEQLFRPDNITNLNGTIENLENDYGVELETKADPHLHYLATEHIRWYKRVKLALINRFNNDIIGAFRQLQDEGYIEILAGAATHAYLPLLSRDSTVFAQIKTGIQVYERIFGRKPRGFWLPECAYRPAIVGGDQKIIRAGLEKFLFEQGILYTFTETHSITGGQPVGVATGEIIGPTGTIKRRYMLPSKQPMPKRTATTYRPYFINDTSRQDETTEHSGVIVIGRNNTTVQQVWSSDWGYPGDFDYREYSKRSGTSGLPYWRVTGAKVDLAHKDYYHPEWAAFKIDQHAEHFAHLVGDLLRDFNTQTGKIGIISSNYNTELFGHWWFEGISWLGKVLRHLADAPEIDLTTVTEYLQQNPPEEVLNLPEGSWGAGGTSFTWDNTETHWMWEPIYEAEKRMEALATTYTEPSEDERLVLNQVARELLLMQSSDWGFLITTGQAREYAIQRFGQHVDRFKRLAASLEDKQPDTAFAREVWELDKIFQDIDYRWFAPR